MENKNYTQIKCCQCGISIFPNSFNKCTRCRQIQTTHKSKNYILQSCKKCLRYFLPPSKFVHIENESELLLFIFNKYKEIRDLNILESKFEKIEQNSKLILLRLKLNKFDSFNEIDSFNQIDSLNEIDNKKEVDINRNNLNIDNNINTDINANNLITTTIKFKIKNKQCPDCDKMEAKQFWTSIVQVRQKSFSKRTFLLLEQSILKNKILNFTNLKQRKDGIDFYFLDKKSPIKMVSFLDSKFGTKIIQSNRLVTEDRNNNKMKYKFSYSIQIFPINKDDLIILNDSFAKKRNINRLVIVLKVNTRIILLDPLTGKIVEINKNIYWQEKDSFNVIFTSKDLKLFKVADLDEISLNQNSSHSKNRGDSKNRDGDKNNKNINNINNKDNRDNNLNDSDNKNNILINNRKKRKLNVKKLEIKNYYILSSDEQNHCKSHLNLKQNDEVYGYDLGNSNLHFINRNLFKIILIRKKYKNLNFKIQTEKENDREYQFFLEDLLNDSELRSDVNVYDQMNEIIDDFGKFGIVEEK